MLSAKRALIIILLGLFVGSGAFAASQPTPPGPFKASKVPQTETENNHQVANNRHQSTDNMPIEINVHLDTVKIQTNTEHNQGDKGEKSSPGGWITLFTGILAGVAIFQYLVMRRQSKDLHKSIDLMREEVKASKDAGKLARDEFVAAHSPKIRVHGVSFYRGSIQTGEVEKTWKIQCIIDNIGGSPARIITSNLTFDRIPNAYITLPAKLPFSKDKQAISQEVIQQGEFITGSLDFYHTDEIIQLIRQRDMQAGKGPTDLYFFGYIVYMDEIGFMRKTVFCRQFDNQTNRFIKVEDEDHEYSY